MNGLDDMKTLWKELDQADRHIPPVNKVPSRLSTKLKWMEQEEGQGSYLAGAVFMVLVGSAIILLAIQKGNPVGWVAGPLVLGLSGLFLYYSRRWKQVKAQHPEQDLLRYLSARRDQLTLLIRLKWIRVIPALAVGVFFWTLGGGDILPNDSVSGIAIGGFVLVALFLAAVTIWWYRTQHPWKPTELLAEIEDLLKDISVSEKKGD